MRQYEINITVTKIDILRSKSLITNFIYQPVGCRENAVQYTMALHRNCKSFSTTQIRLWTHKTHPIPRPHRRTIGCLLWRFWRKLTAFYRHRIVLYWPVDIWYGHTGFPSTECDISVSWSPLLAWTPFRRHFHMDFLQWKCLNFD